MRWIVGSSLRFRLVVVPIAAVIMLLGVTQLHKTSVDVLPEFAPPYVEVQTEALGLSAEEVEQLITVPLEADLLNGVAWLDEIRSESVPGLSSIVLIFEPGTNLLRARQVVSERLTQAHALPNVSKPPVMLQPLSSTSRVMMIGLSSKDLSLIDVSVLARWTIRPRLLGVPGVANVAIWGQREQQLQVQVDPQRLRDQGVSLLQVIKTTGNALIVSPLSFLESSTPGTGGFIDTPNQRLGVQHVLPISSPQDLAKVAVEGSTLRLGDVANVVVDHQPLIGDALTNNGAGLLLVVEKFPGANTLEVTRGVEAALDELRPGLSGIAVDSSAYRPATFIEMAIDNLALVLVIAFVLSALALGVLFYNWRTALISVVAIPLSLVAAGLVLYAQKATVNAMTLAGLVLAVAFVVDDAVIDVEHIVRRLRQHRQKGSGKSTARIVLQASLAMRSAVLYATLIAMMAVLPAFFMGGLLGVFSRPLALSYALAVLVSMVVALTVTPALALILLRKAPLEHRESRLVRWLQRRYDVAASRIIRTPRPAFFAAGAIALVGLAAIPLLRQSPLPSFKEPDLLIHWDGAPGTSRPEMSRIAAAAREELRSLPGVRSVGAHVGRAITSDQVVGVNSSELWVNIDPAADYDATVASIQKVVDGYPGLQREVLTYLKERSAKAATATEEDIVVRVYGQDLDVLRGKAEEVRKALSDIDGVVDPQMKLPAQEPILEVEVDLDAADEFGIKPGDVRRAAATLLSGIQVGSLFEQQKVFEVVVWGTPEIRRSLTGVRELLIDKPGGGHVRLGDVADVRIASAPSVIKRDAVSTYIDVSADVRGRGPAAVVADVERRLQEVEFPLEYHPEVRGTYVERQAVANRMLWITVAAAIGILLLLQAAFQSWRLASVVLLLLPLALAGGALAAFASGGVISLGSIAGFFVVFGIAARNAVLLVRHYQHLERHEGETYSLGLVLRGTRERLAPIVMTAATTGLALLPAVLFRDLPGLETVHPTAVVVLGGLVTSTLFSLLVVPALYWRFGSSPEPEFTVEEEDRPEVDLTTVG
ncbi:MAG: efflux RND transporter permease subunit [Egibacteraceae bacterium]